MRRQRIRPALIMALLALMSTSGATSALSGRQAAPSFDLQQALGTWRSAEQFEGESRLSFAFKQQATEITGWAVLLGQHRKADDRATLGLTFCGVRWEKDRLRFETVLPDEDGTIGWELRVTAQNRATLTALTENGRPIPDELVWQMAK